MVDVAAAGRVSGVSVCPGEDFLPEGEGAGERFFVGGYDADS